MEYRQLSSVVATLNAQYTLATKLNSTGSIAGPDRKFVNNNDGFVSFLVSVSNIRQERCIRRSTNTVTNAASSNRASTMVNKVSTMLSCDSRDNVEAVPKTMSL